MFKPEIIRPASLLFTAAVLIERQDFRNTQCCALCFLAQHPQGKMVRNILLIGRAKAEVCDKLSRSDIPAQKQDCTGRHNDQRRHCVQDVCDQLVESGGHRGLLLRSLHLVNEAVSVCNLILGLVVCLDDLHMLHLFGKPGCQAGNGVLKPGLAFVCYAAGPEGAENNDRNDQDKAKQKRPVAHTGNLHKRTCDEIQSWNLNDQQINQKITYKAGIRRDAGDIFLGIACLCLCCGQGKHLAGGHRLKVPMDAGLGDIGSIGRGKSADKLRQGQGKER